MQEDKYLFSAQPRERRGGEIKRRPLDATAKRESSVFPA
jgi:hypothetical protein